MLPIINSHLKVNDYQFKKFCDAHQHWIDRGVAVTEDNEDMVNGYLMIDPYGRLFQNSPGEGGGYEYSPSILDVGIEKAMSDIKFDYEKYLKRYQPIGQGEK